MLWFNEAARLDESIHSRNNLDICNRRFGLADRERAGQGFGFAKHSRIVVPEWFEGFPTEQLVRARSYAGDAEASSTIGCPDSIEFGPTPLSRREDDLNSNCRLIARIRHRTADLRSARAQHDIQRSRRGVCNLDKPDEKINAPQVGAFQV